MREAGNVWCGRKAVESEEKKSGGDNKCSSSKAGPPPMAPQPVSSQSHFPPLASPKISPKISSIPSPSPKISSSSSSAPNSSSVLQTLQDTLYEYIKGLQDAVKLPDADLAERLLVEIGGALAAHPNAVPLIISANGARLIASCVKHFRSAKIPPSPAKIHPDPAPELSPMDDPPPPPLPTSESRRKRQRTAEEIDDEEEPFVVPPSRERERERESFRKPVRIKGRSLKVRSRNTEAGVDEKKSKGVVENCWLKPEITTSNQVEVADDELGEEPSDQVDDVANLVTTDVEEGDAVYTLAKVSGMSNVVATACSALDKLLTAALQAKGSAAGVTAAAGPKTKAIPSNNNSNNTTKRGKSLSAEMYVALTEAFVDMVHVLKDNVELLSWCLNCLGSILPPGGLDRASLESTTGLVKEAAAAVSDVAAAERDQAAAAAAAVQPAVSAAASAVESATATVSSVSSSLLDQKLFPSKALLKLATKYREHSAAVAAATSSADFTLKIGAKSASGSYVAAARTLTSTGKGGKGILQSAFCGGITSESTSSSISALAAVAYAATVPMLAEKAVKAVLAAMQSCDVEARSTMAALRALSAHLSSTNSKSTCDDAFTFIIAAMREFLTDPDMQAESCLALGSLVRAVSSTTGHAAWTAITISMEAHRDNLTVQRAGCGALQVLCTRTGLGIPEWRTGKRPLRAAKDADRESGARALILSMQSFPSDVRIQWHGCSTLWTLVHSAGVKSVASMVKCGAVPAVVGAMSVCRMNEMMQQEGCNVIGTMVRTLAENGHEIGLYLSPINKSRSSEDDDGKEQDPEKVVLRSSDWWTALGAVVGAMKMFSKSKSLQSNGTFALGCILKGSGETATFGTGVADIEKHLSSAGGGDVKPGSDPGSTAESLRLSFQLLGKDIVDNAERISAAVEVTMIAMREFSKVETVQVWGCAVLQQAFLAYVHYAKCLGPVSEACSSVSSLQSRLFSPKPEDPGAAADAPKVDDSNPPPAAADAQKGDDSNPTPSAPSPSESFAKFILSQATSAMYMISRTMALSYTGASSGVGSGAGEASETKLATSQLVARGKSTLCSRSQASSSSLFFSSVRQSWCAALGAIGDVFGYLTRSSEAAPPAGGKAAAAATGTGRLGGTSSDCMEFFRSSRSFFDRSSSSVSAVAAEIASSCGGDDRSEDSESERSEKSSLDTAKDNSSGVEEEKLRRPLEPPPHCSSASWIDWTGFGASTQQAVKDIKAWQEATESMSKIAEGVGFPLSVKNAILSIRTIFYKLEDAETVIWACHALVSLYLTWESLHLFRPGTEIDREEYKAKIWGEGEAGVRQLVDLVVHWTNQNRLDVTSLALQALYGACVFAATVQEIEKVFALGSSGAEAVLGALQKALLSGSAQHRRKVVQQACCVLATVCGYSIRAQVAVAVHGGADLILTALDRYNEDNQIQVNGLHALGIDSHAQPDFDAVWNSAISRNVPGGGKSTRRKRGSQSSSSVVSLAHIFREGVGSSSFRDTLSVEEGMECLKGKWNPCFQRLVLQGAAPIGLFRTAVLAAPGCGGPAFAMELLRRLSDNSVNSAELQAHVCFVVGYLSEHSAVLRNCFVDAGALRAVLGCMSAVYCWRRGMFSSFEVLCKGGEVELRAECGDESPLPAPAALSEDAALNGVDLRIQCAAAWAVAGLAKSQCSEIDDTRKSVIQALAVALHRYGGLMSMPAEGLRIKKPQPEVCVPARLALARLGVFRLSSGSQGVYLVHEAAETGDLLCLKALVEAGVDITVTDAEGKNGEWHAELHGQAQAAQMLKEQVQLLGRRKAREKAKAKSKQQKKAGNTFKRDLEEDDREEQQHQEKQEKTPPSVTEEEAEPLPLSAPVVNGVGVQLECPDDSVTTPVIEPGEDPEKPKISQRALRNNRKKLQKAAMKSQSSEEPAVEKPRVEQQQQQEEGVPSRLNSALREAMASGEVEKMELVLKACEGDEAAGDSVDERLVKQVRGALAKRLKRREKAGILEEELDAAIAEASRERLAAAVAAAEQSSRLAAGLREKLEVAKGLLEVLEKEALEQQRKQEAADGDARKLEVIEAEKLEVIEQQVEPEAEAPKVEEEVVELEEQPWFVQQKGRKHQLQQQQQQQQQNKENVEAPTDIIRTRTRGGRGRKHRNNRNHQPGPQGTNNNTSPQPVVLPVRLSARTPAPGAPSVVLPETTTTSTATQRDLPPLLPLPTPSPRMPPPGICSAPPRSVIMPPKLAAAAGQASTSSSLEHNPITPQLFPANRSPLVCNTDAVQREYYSTQSNNMMNHHHNNNSNMMMSNNDYGSSCGGASQLSMLLSSTWSSPRSSSSLEEGRWGGGGTWPAASSRCSTPVDDGGFTISGLDHFQPQLHPQPQPQPQPQPYQHHKPGAVGGGVGDPWYVSAMVASLFPGERVGGERAARMMMEAGNSYNTSSSLFWEENPRRRMGKMMGEAGMEESCCICYEEPKDAALVPCGHRMCKRCAQRMRSVRLNCPLCNRYIDGVLALYG